MMSSKGTTIFINIDDLKEGDIVEFVRADGLYRHCGIYDGNYGVIHRAAEPRVGSRGAIDLRGLLAIFGIESDKAEIRRDDIRTVAGSSDVYRANIFDSVKQPRHDTLRRAEKRLGEKGYNILSKNCQHFCTEARYGTAMNMEVELHSGLRTCHSYRDDRILVNTVQFPEYLNRGLFSPAYNFLLSTRNITPSTRLGTLWNFSFRNDRCTGYHLYQSFDDTFSTTQQGFGTRCSCYWFEYETSMSVGAMSNFSFISTGYHLYKRLIDDDTFSTTRQSFGTSWSCYWCETSMRLGTMSTSTGYPFSDSFKTDIPSTTRMNFDTSSSCYCCEDKPSTSLVTMSNFYNVNEKRTGYYSFGEEILYDCYPAVTPSTTQQSFDTSSLHSDMLSKSSYNAVLKPLKCSYTSISAVECGICGIFRWMLFPLILLCCIWCILCLFVFKKPKEVRTWSDFT